MVKFTSKLAEAQAFESWQEAASAASALASERDLNVSGVYRRGEDYTAFAYNCPSSHWQKPDMAQWLFAAEQPPEPVKYRLTEAGAQNPVQP